MSTLRNELYNGKNSPGCIYLKFGISTKYEICYDKEGFSVFLTFLHLTVVRCEKFQFSV